MDKMTMRRMAFYGYHGVFAEENKLGQRFYVDATFHLDLSTAGRSDELADTVNYAEVYKKIQEIVENETFQLIEALAERIATQVLNHYTIMKAITIKVIKPNPPFAIYFEGVEVEIYREKTDEP